VSDCERWGPDPDAPFVTPGDIRDLDQIAVLLCREVGRGLHSRSWFYETFNTPPEPCPTCERVQDIFGHVGGPYAENWQPVQECATYEHGIGQPNPRLVAIWFDGHWQLRPSAAPQDRATDQWS
jgi:hypothetical protein